MSRAPCAEAGRVPAIWTLGFGPSAKQTRSSSRFTVVRAAVLLVAVCVLAACAPGGRTADAPTAWPSTSAPASASPQPPLGAAGSGELANCPAIVRNVSGAYAFQCSASWKFINCEATNGNGSYTWLVNPGTPGCWSELYGARMMVLSEPGDHSADPENHQGIYAGTRQSSQPVTVAGVSGTRRTYVVSADNPLPPPKNTAQVLYTFVTGGRTYFADYDRYPGDTDLTAAFDQMVMGSFRFSA